MGSLELCRLLDRGLVQYRMFEFQLHRSSYHANMPPQEYLDDILFDDIRPQGHFMVAVLALRLDRLQYCGLLHLHDRTDRCNIPHLLSRRYESLFWHLGFAVAGFQSSGNGLYLVRSAVMDWRCVFPTLCSPEQLAKLSLQASV